MVLITITGIFALPDDGWAFGCGWLGGVILQHARDDRRGEVDLSAPEPYDQGLDLLHLDVLPACGWQAARTLVEMVVLQLCYPQFFLVRGHLLLPVPLVGKQVALVFSSCSGGDGCSGGKDKETPGGGFNAAALHCRCGELRPGAQAGGTLLFWRGCGAC